MASSGVAVRVFASMPAVLEAMREPAADVIVIGCTRADDATLPVVRTLSTLRPVVVLLSNNDVASIRLFFLAGASDVSIRFQSATSLAGTIVGAEAIARAHRNNGRLWQPTA